MPARDVSSQLKPLALIALLAYGPAAGLLLAVAIVSRIGSVPVSEFTRDPVAVSGASFYTGVISQIGILLWSATATVCLFTFVARRDATHEAKTIWFLGAAGMLSLVLLFDDAFLFHEHIAPKYLRISNTVVFALYGVMVAAFLWFFRCEILRSEYLVFGVAVGFLAASVVLDKLHDVRLFSQFDDLSKDSRYMLDDGTKLLGIVGWFVYFARYCLECFSPHRRLDAIDSAPDA